jgi:hypothetical protein
MQDNNVDLQVEVAYALPDVAHIIPLHVAPGATIREVIELSSILQRCPEIDLGRDKVGIFSIPQNLDNKVSNGDRVEIYRDLQIDPMEARRRRAEKQKADIS